MRPPASSRFLQSRRGCWMEKPVEPEGEQLLATDRAFLKPRLTRMKLAVAAASLLLLVAQLPTATRCQRQVRLQQPYLAGLGARSLLVWSGASPRGGGAVGREALHRKLAPPAHAKLQPAGAAAAANGSQLQAPEVAHSGANYHHWLACATALAPTYPTQASAAAHLDSEQDQFVQVVRRAKPAPCRAVARYRWHDWRRWPYTPASRGLCARLATVPLLGAAQVAGGEFVVGCRKFYISGWNQ